MRRRWVMTVMAVFLVAAACGGGGEESSTSNPATTEGVEATTAAPTTASPATTDGVAHMEEPEAEPAKQDGNGVRAVEIVMTDFAFSPDSLAVSEGETIEFTFVNEGVIEHEARFDTFAGVEDHIAGGHDGHEHGAGPQALIVPPGETMTMTMTFEEGGYYNVLACTLPGHFEAGMWAEITGLVKPAVAPTTLEVTAFDASDLEAVAGQAQVVGVLTGIDFVDSAGFHGMSEALAAGEFSGRELGAVEKVIAALTSIAWPHELEEVVGSFLADLEALAAGLEAEDVSAAAEAAHTVHESQHGFSHDVYAFLSGGGEHAHGADLEAVAGQAQVVGVLTGIDFVDSAGFHGMSEALAAGEFSGRELGAVEKVIAALTSIAWPHELEEVVGSFLADLEALAAGLEAEDVSAAAEAAHTVHESQHGFSHDVYAFLSGGGDHH